MNIDTVASGYRKRGVKIGKRVLIWGKIDLHRPDIVQIGDFVVIATNTWIITHCPIRLYKKKGIKTIIGNNVYIGMGSYVLPGIKIGDNVIIGAGSVVSKDIPSGVIAAGNPCKVIRKITEEESSRTRLLTLQNKVADGKL